MPLGRLVSGSSSQLSTPTLDKMTRAIRAKGSLPSRTHAIQGIVVKGKGNLIRPSPHGQPQSALAKAADSGEWQDGQRFSSGASKDEVRTWAKTL